MNFTAHLNTKKYTNQMVFGFNRALVCANEEKVSLILPNSDTCETTVAYISQKLKYRASLKTIRVLLGHECSKPTEIYKHLTTNGFDQIRSMLDQLFMHDERE
jgi:ribosomal protein L30E